MLSCIPLVQSLHNWWSIFNTCIQMLPIITDLHACQLQHTAASWSAGSERINVLSCRVIITEPCSSWEVACSTRRVWPALWMRHLQSDKWKDAGSSRAAFWKTVYFVFFGCYLTWDLTSLSFLFLHSAPFIALWYSRHCAFPLSSSAITDWYVGESDWAERWKSSPWWENDWDVSVSISVVIFLGIVWCRIFWDIFEDIINSCVHTESWDCFYISIFIPHIMEAWSHCRWGVDDQGKYMDNTKLNEYDV